MFTYLLILFHPIVKRQNTYIRDTPHFIRMIESLQASPNCTLVAYDCTSTYTNMEFNELKQAVNDVLPQVVSCQGLNNTIQKHQVVRLVETLLTNNYFSFNGKLYHQTIGASMGAIPSPEICDIRLHQILEHLIKNSPHKNKIITHVRFKDDGFMIWENATKEDITNFFHTANNFHHLLKFTHLLSKQEITFLDTTVYKGKKFTNSRILDIKTQTKKGDNPLKNHRVRPSVRPSFRLSMCSAFVRKIWTA